jgi:hypothetical protein
MNMAVLDLKRADLGIGLKKQSGNFIANVPNDFDKISIVGGDHHPD